jgi:hypothetical protein
VAEATVTGVEDVKAMLADLAVTMPRAAIDATNQTIYQLWGAEKLQMVADLDRPVPYTLNAILYERMNAGGKGGKVWVKDLIRSTGADENQYIGVQTIGTTSRSRMKGSEKALQEFGIMPSGMVWVPDRRHVALDSHGNVSARAIKSMVDEFRKWRDARNPTRNFALIKGKGILTRVGGEWYPFIWFVTPRQYKARFDFYGRADKEMEYAFGDIYAKAIQKELDRHR